VVDLQVATFGNWAHKLLGSPPLVGAAGPAKIWSLGRHLGYSQRFLGDEVDYILGMFPPEAVDTYGDASFTRDGRGRSPQVSIAMRQQILSEVVHPYQRWKTNNGIVDWNDEASLAASARLTDPYHVIIVDEAQDFSANQIRAIAKHLADDHSLTFVIDRAQRIYARHYTWRSVGLTIRKTFPLTENYRNTAEIAAFARPLVDGIDVGEGGSLPDFAACSRHGGVPVLVAGSFTAQMDWAIERLATIPNDETAAFLHVAGGGYFKEVKRRLREANYDYCEITQKSEWPDGSENIALSTMHSSKGIEFDHVFIVGLSAQTTAHGNEDGDAQFENLRRLLAMAIGRARKTVMLGYKPGKQSDLIALLDPATYSEIRG
jgi:superfamily I DNA/RNA helicase